MNTEFKKTLLRALKIFAKALALAAGMWFLLIAGYVTGYHDGYDHAYEVWVKSKE